MSTTEYRRRSTVRIHDDMCVNAPERWAEQLSFIVIGVIQKTQR